MGDGRPTIEELREREHEKRSREMHDKMAVRWAKDWLLVQAGQALAAREATLPEDAEQMREDWIINLKRALRELWDSYQFPPDYSYDRPYYDYEPPEDFRVRQPWEYEDD